jgi:hypothetical protein
MRQKERVLAMSRRYRVLALLLMAALGLGALRATAARAAPAREPASVADLKYVALQQSDLPGYSLFSEDATTSPGAIASYFAVWSTPRGANQVVVANGLDAYQSSAAAGAILSLRLLGLGDLVDPGTLDLLTSPGIGDLSGEADFYLNGTPSCAVIFVRGSTLTTALAGAFSFRTACGTAEWAAATIDRRIVAFEQATAPRPAPTTAPAPRNTPTPAPARQPTPAPRAPQRPLNPALVPQGVAAVAAQYAASVGYGYAGDCQTVTAAQAGQICTYAYGPDSAGNYLLSYSVVGDDGSPGAPYASQVVTPDDAAAALASRGGGQQ